MVALDAKPFLPETYGGHGLDFRSGDEESGECTASECKLLAKDFWRIGGKKWVLVPRVAVTYTEEAYNSEWINSRVRRGGPRVMDQEIRSGVLDKGPKSAMAMQELIEWNKVKDPKQVECFPWRNGLPYQPSTSIMVSKLVLCVCWCVFAHPRVHRTGDNRNRPFERSTIQEITKRKRTCTPPW